MLASLQEDNFNDRYEVLHPDKWNWFNLRPANVSRKYRNWPLVKDIYRINSLNGMMEKRGGLLIDIDRQALEERMQDYFNKDISWEELKAKYPRFTKDAAGEYKAEKVRMLALASHKYEPDAIIDYLFHPFDVRHAYYTDISKLWNSNRAKLKEQLSSQNKFLISRPSGVIEDEGAPLLVSSCIGDNDCIMGHSKYIPFKDVSGRDTLASKDGSNIAELAKEYLDAIGLSANSQSDAWMLHCHFLAIGYSPLYLNKNKDGVAIDWIRMPLPDSKDLLESSARLGKRIAGLLDVLAPLDSVLEEELDRLSVIGLFKGAERAVNAGWGSRGDNGRVFPGNGKYDFRPWDEAEEQSLRAIFARLDIAADKGFGCLGEATNVHLNGTTYWSGIPSEAWHYRIGGYQVIKKWLSYREQRVLGRKLKTEEVRYVTNIARRIALIILMHDRLDQNYQDVCKKTYKWKPLVDIGACPR